MIPTKQKERTFHAITFFLDHTNNCYKKKLYKLLFLVDFEAFRVSGRKITHFDYFAWKMGPVPTELHEAIESRDQELFSRFQITNEQLGENIVATKLVTNVPFEPKYFSDKELKIMMQIAESWQTSTANDLEYFTHRPGSPWDKVWNLEKRAQEKIPFSYSLDNEEEAYRETVLAIAEEKEAVRNNYQ